MHNHFLSYKNSRISYYRFGAGPKTALCFHGYGEDGTAYRFLEKYAGDHYTFIAIDLPFHGQTQWNEKLPFTTEDLQQLLEKLFGQNNLKPLNLLNIKPSLIGFSLGGRIALSLYQACPAHIEKLVLLAPDGLKVNFWYWLATGTRIGNRLFAFTMKHPGWFLGFLRGLNQLRLVNGSIFKFVNHYIGDEKVRRQLYERWTGLRKLSPDAQSNKTAIRQYHTPVRLIYGRHDRIIRSDRAEKFRRGIEEHCTITILPSGHQVLQEKHAAEIVAALFH